MIRKAVITIQGIDGDEKISVDFGFDPPVERDIPDNPIYEICTVFMKALKEKADKIDVKNLE